MMALLYASRQYFHDLGIEAGGESKEKKAEDQFLYFYVNMNI